MKNSILEKNAILEKMVEDWNKEESEGKRQPTSIVDKKETVIRTHYTGPPYTKEPTPLERLTQYSITGQSKNLRKQMLDDQFVLKDMAIMGQWTTIYGAPNSGKTLITNWLLRESILSESIDGELVFYINADDNYRGLVEKIELAENWGMHMIAPHHKHFTVDQGPELLAEMADDGSARGAVVILDTLKKFTDLMDKRVASQFGVAARGFVSAGGTLIALAHTNKHAGADGKSIYSGTSDIVDDSDCCFIIDKISVDERFDAKTHTIEYTNIKARGDVSSKVGFTYEKSPGQEYTALLDSVKRVDEHCLKEIKGKAKIQAALEEDAEIIQIILALIKDGTFTKAKIIKDAHEISGESTARVKKVLERCTGASYQFGHRWRQKTESHNRHVFEILPAHS